MSSPVSLSVMASMRAAARDHRLEGRFSTGLTAKPRMEHSFRPLSIMAHYWATAAESQPDFVA